jgi:hypothetical protein
VWFLDALVAFSQFDNPLFVSFVESMRGEGRRLASSTTVVQSILPLIYTYCTEFMVKVLRRTVAYHTSFDGWSCMGQKFISQTYHVITSDTFESYAMLLDLMPYRSQQFAETMGGALIHRQEHWTEGIIPELIAAGGIADAEYKGQAAGKHIYGEENQLRCQNHSLLWVFNMAQARSPTFANDTSLLDALCAYVASHGNVSKELRWFQHAGELGVLSVKTSCDTRWEGTKLQVERAVALAESLQSLRGSGFLSDLPGSAKVADFLEPSFFERLKAYNVVLSNLNHVSKLYQTQTFPVGCLVPLGIGYLEAALASSDMDPHYLATYKKELWLAVTERMVKPVLGCKNTFLMAALLHPGVAAYLLHSGKVQDDVLSACWNGIGEEALLLVQDVGEREEERAFIQGALATYKKLLPLPAAESELPAIEISQLVLDGTYLGVNHMSFWQSVSKKEHERHLHLAHLLPVASMLLAIPASEAIDEFAFSSSGRTLTADRNTLAPQTTEIITVVRMFIKTFGWSHRQLDGFVVKALEEYKKNQAAKEGKK